MIKLNTSPKLLVSNLMKDYVLFRPCITYIDPDKNNLIIPLFGHTLNLRSLYAFPCMYENVFFLTNPQLQIISKDARKKTIYIHS